MTASRGIRVRRGTRQRWVEQEQGKHFCGCGCGAPIPLTPEHFNLGIPRYLLGHNARVNPPKPRKETPAQKPCECGCGELASPGRRYLVGHNSTGRVLSAEARARLREANTGERSHRFGKRARNWKGGRVKAGPYVAVWAPDHPLSRGRYILEHRLLMERHLQEVDPESEFLVDGYLHRGVDVHHVNGVHTDNRLENLRAMWRSEHTRLHHEINRARNQAA